MKRFTYTNLTTGEVEAIVGSGTILRENPLYTKPVYSDALTGKAFTLRFDNGEVLSYSFKDPRNLTWKDGEGPDEKTYYEALDLGEGVVLFYHLIGGTNPQRALIVVLDFEQSLTTAALAVIGNPFAPREVTRDIMSGYIDLGASASGGAGVPEKRHEVTTEILQRSVLWHYGPLDEQYIYVSRLYSLSFDYNTANAGMLMPAPCSYLKINDHTYIHNWMEVERSGRLGFSVMNLHEMKIVGCTFGINRDDKLEFFGSSGKGELMGQFMNFDLPNYYHVKDGVLVK
jgi:hypothetical protein